ncbi:MAG: hypothetical protein NVS2B14_00470 [Chamaesiphon sp.]
MTLVKDCEGSTIAVRGLDLQLFWKLNQLAPNTLVSIADLNINAGEGLFPYLQVPARSALQAVLRERAPLTINSAYRSIIAQAMLFSQKQRGLIDNLVAFPGRSDHQKGASVDVEEWSDDGVVDLFEEHDWYWTYGSRDPMHFDCISDGIVEIRPDSVRAFQLLWNQANPENQIAVDGSISEGGETLQAIYNSPAEGFYKVGYPRILKLTTPYQVGVDVGRLQLALRSAGINLKLADTVFGEATDVAVRSYQSAHGLPVDGVVGAGMRKALNL